jgi:hypothetical protein
MKSSTLLLLFAIGATTVVADDAKTILVTPGKTVAAPTLTEPLDATWSVVKGTWDVKDGEMIGAEVKEQKHAAVLWHKVGLQSAVIDCDFMFDGAGAFIIGCDGQKHVGRVSITRGSARITDDSTAVKGIKPPTTLAEAKLDLKPGEWHHAHLEWTGDKMAARIDGTEFQGSSPALSTPKTRWWFAVGGAKLHIKNVKATEGARP